MTTIAAYKAEAEVASSSAVVVILVLVAFLAVVEREEVGMGMVPPDQDGAWTQLPRGGPGGPRPRGWGALWWCVSCDIF